MNNLSLLPEHKNDLRALNHLAKLSSSELQPYIPQLLRWLQDMNWPIAEPVAQLLSSYPEQLIQPIKNVLHSSDAVWKYWILNRLASILSSEQLDSIRPELEQLVNHPTPDEIDEGVSEIAAALMKKL